MKIFSTTSPSREKGLILKKKDKFFELFYCIEKPVKICLILIALSGAAFTEAAEVRVEKSKEGWRLIVDGKPFFIKGVCYQPLKVGENFHDNTARDWMTVDDDKDGRVDVAYQAWVDKNRNNKQDADEKEIGDFQLLKEMGCNAIRIYHHASSKFKIQSLNYGNNLFNHAPNKNLLRDLYNSYGIMVMMGDFIGSFAIGSGATWEEGTDYRDPVQLRNMMASVKDMVLEFKDEPYVLLWALGNENNFPEESRTNCNRYPKEFAVFVNRVARWIHEVDPNHPVCLVNGETYFLDIYAKYAPEIDIFGLNCFRNEPGFGALWYEVAAKYPKPVLLTEFGIGNSRALIELDEDMQVFINRNSWMDIFAHSSGRKPPGNAIGGFVFEWLDNWAQDGEPLIHNLNTDCLSLEWQGICSQGNGSRSPLLRQLRKVYYTYKELWKDPVYPQVRDMNGIDRHVNGWK